MVLDTIFPLLKMELKTQEAAVEVLPNSLILNYEMVDKAAQAL
jgi:hypothetical protein